MSREALPHVAVNVAISADGKIAPASRHFVPFSSKRDHDSMMELRSRADAVLSGARTVDLAKVNMGPGGKKYQQARIANGLKEFNLRVIASGSASINPEAHIFRERFSPILLLTTERAPKSRISRIKKLVDDIFISPGESLDFRAALAWLREKWAVKNLLCEGGGEVNAPMFRAHLVHELYVTICPVLLGGRQSPTLADGLGIQSLNDASRLRLVQRNLVHNELYCVYEVLK